MAVPSHTLMNGDKIALRRAAREARKAFVERLSPKDKAAQEEALADVLAQLAAASRIVGGYYPLPQEVSPLPAMRRAAAGGATLAFPAFSDHQASLRFLAGEPRETGPWAIMQPALISPEVFPDLILVPLVAVDRRGTRLGQGKGHYDRVLGELRRRGALLVGVGWANQMIDEEIPADPWDVALDAFASPDALTMLR